jgi:hypothetical protein
VIGSMEALQAAKYNLEKHYAVVGIASDLDMSLKVMEEYLPRLENTLFLNVSALTLIHCSFFRSATSMYNRLPKTVYGQSYRRNEAAANKKADTDTADTAKDPNELIIADRAYQERDSPTFLLSLCQR